MVVFRRPEPRVAHLDAVNASHFKLMLEAQVEVEPRVVVAFRDGPARSIADDENRVGVLPQAVAHDLETDAFAGLYLEAIAIHGAFTKRAPDTRRQIFHHQQAGVGQPILRGDSHAADADRSIDRNRDVHHDAIRLALDRHGLDRPGRQRVPQVECCPEIAPGERHTSDLAAWNERRRNAFDAVIERDAECRSQPHSRVGGAGHGSRQEYKREWKESVHGFVQVPQGFRPGLKKTAAPRRKTIFAAEQPPVLAQGRSPGTCCRNSAGTGWRGCNPVDVVISVAVRAG